MDNLRGDRFSAFAKSSKVRLEEEELLADFYDLIFEEQLNGWWTEKSAWPANRDLALFKDWFDVEFHSAVLDLVDAPLEDDEVSQ